MRMRLLIDRLDRARALDRPGNAIQSRASKLFRGRVADTLHGVQVGHPLHPIAVLLPIGSWVSAAVLQALRVRGRGPAVLLGLGSAAAVPAAVLGVNDWTSLSREQRRVGLVHAVANTVSLGLHVAALVAYRRRNPDTARWLNYAGLAAVGAGGYLGGHLTYRQAAGVNLGEAFLRQIPEGWHTLCDLQALTPGKPQVYRIGDVPVLVTRNGDQATVMIENCGHQTGPLGDGNLTRVDGTDCIVCPWHGSTFRLTDGTVVHGPATTSQPLLRTRVQNGRVEAALP